EVDSSNTKNWLSAEGGLTWQDGCGERKRGTGECQVNEQTTVESEITQVPGTIVPFVVRPKSHAFSYSRGHANQSDQSVPVCHGKYDKERPASDHPASVLEWSRQVQRLFT